MATAVIKPEHEAKRKHFLFSDEHLDLRESMSAWVKKELYPHRNEWEESYWPSEAMRRAGEASSWSRTAPLNSRMPRPIERPISGSRLGPKTSSAITSTMMIWIGEMSNTRAVLRVGPSPLG